MRSGLGWSGLGEPREQAELGRPVRLERPVELEMLVGQVREDRRIVGDRADPLGRQAVGRGLEDRGAIPRDHHRPKELLEPDRSRGGHVAGGPLADRPDARLDGPHEPGRDPGRLECSRDEV